MGRRGYIQQARDRRGYLLSLGPDDMQALAYIAGRYESGRELFNGLEIESDAEEARFASGHRALWIVSEHVAWSYRDALESEGGVIPPFAGGHLAEELFRFYDRIV